MSNLRDGIIAFTKSEKEAPVVAAIAAGLYPLLYYYNKNFTLLNSWEQFFFFFFIFICIPIVLFLTANLIVKNVVVLKNYNNYIFSVFNFGLFAVFLVIITYGLKIKILLLASLIATLLGILFVKHLKKIIIFQFLLAIIVATKLIPDLYRHFTYSSDWMIQPDNIEQTVFKKKPNVYIIQPDGYANFSELKDDNYNFDNSDFENFLRANAFNLYYNFRSNYNSTLSSNSSMFAMKHHYFNNPKPGINELYNSRDIIVGDNPVISIFENNGYKTVLLIEKGYLLLNRPKQGYDFSNITNADLSYFSRGNEILSDIETDLKTVINQNTNENSFVFIEKLKPGHISTYENTSLGKEKERLKYIKELNEANQWLKNIVNTIQENDANSMIVIVADHGGFVGMDYTGQLKEKQTDDELVKTIFSSALAIKWPDDAPDFDNKLKTNINLFRIIFAYLSENESILNHLQDDKSYTIIEKGADFGVYELMNQNGDVVFKKFD